MDNRQYTVVGGRGWVGSGVETCGEVCDLWFGFFRSFLAHLEFHFGSIREEEGDVRRQFKAVYIKYGA